MRCLAVAQAWQDLGGNTTFAVAECPDALAERLLQEQMQVVRTRADTIGGAEDAQGTVALAHQLRAPWIMIDGYHFGELYQRLVADAGARMLLLDDGNATCYVADAVLNPNPYAEPSRYANLPKHTKLLLGSRFLLLRREFAAWRNWQRMFPPHARRLLVAMGGSDPENVTLRVAMSLRQLKNMSDLRTILLVGGSNPHSRALEGYASSNLPGMQIRQNVSDVPDLFAWADAGVISAGTTAWEACAMGLPMLLLRIVDNQREVAPFLHQAGAARALRINCSPEELSQALLELLESPDLRERLSRRARALVGPDGAHRVVAATLLS
jgi:UDP-2,4-diacetamido-2,4,6-trideoxy-beta-L-altropyranose hydrolase